MYNDGFDDGSGTNPLGRLPQNSFADAMKTIMNTAKIMTGKSREECEQKLFKEYGNSYEIIGCRTYLKGGFLGIGQREVCDVKYVLKPRPLTSREAFEQNKQDFINKVSGGNSQSFTQLANINKQLEELKESFDSKLKDFAVANSSSGKHPSVQKIEDLLVQNEFTLSYINGITNRLRAELPMESLDDFDFVQRTVVDWIGKSISIYPKLPMKPPHVIVLVGPTGVGKTTTIAKLAGSILVEAKNKNQPRPSIRMITIDHTRVGAEEQLERFGTIMSIPVEKAQNAADVKKIFDMYKEDLDVLFIDTPGYSPNDFANIGKMREILGIPGMSKDVYLTITASVKARDLLSIIQVYEQFNYDSVIITKWDETNAFGNVLSVLAEKNKPIAYIADGQKVPREIKRASVVECLKFLNDFKIDREHIEEIFSENKNQ